MSANKTVATSADVMAFLQAVEPPARRADALAVLKLMGEVSGEPAVMWGSSIVGFGRYHYRYDSGREGDFLRIGFSPRKAALTLYLMDGFEAHADLMARLGKHKTGRACLYLKRLSDVDLDVLRELMRRSLDELARRYPL